MLKEIFFLHKSPGFFSRLGARLIDYCLFYIAATFVSLFVPFYIDGLFYLLFAIFLPLFWIPLEAFLLSRWGTTVGKKIFGLQVRTHLGTKLSYPIALKRSACFGVRPGVIRQAPFPRKKKIFALVVCFASLFGAIYEQELSDYSIGFQNYKTIDGWVDYTSDEGGFSVLFPSDPQQESKIIPLPDQNRTLNYNELKSYQDSKIYYSVSYMKLPRKWKLAGASRILQGALDGIVEHSEGTVLIDSHFEKHKSYRTLDFHYSQGKEDVQGRLVLVGTTLYRLTVTYPPSGIGKLQHQEFLDSFDVSS